MFSEIARAESCLDARKEHGPDWPEEEQPEESQGEEEDDPR